jgi:hypothetical protein
MQGPQSQMDNPTALLTLMSLSEKSTHVWAPEELAAILGHELRAPLLLALGKFAGEAAAILPCSATIATPQTLEDLLRQNRPSPEILDVVKKFAKSSSMEGAEDGTPREIGLLLYFLSIAVARVRCQTRLSDLPDDAVINGLRWMLGQDWVSEPIRGLAGDVLDRLSESKAGG